MGQPSKISVGIISAVIGKTPEEIANSFVFDEAYRLARKGIDVHVIRRRVEREAPSYSIHFHGLERKVDVRAVESMLENLHVYPPVSLLRNPARIYWENVYAVNVSKVIRENKIDLIHAHFTYPEGLAGLSAKMKTGRPLIVTVHGYDILSEPSLGYGVRLNKRIDAITRRVLNSADAVVAASSATFKEASKIVDKPDKIYLIPNGVDVERFNPNLDGAQIRRRLGIELRPVIFAMRLHEPVYGLEYLIRAVPLVTKKNDNAFFVIGGDGTLRRFHEQLAVKLGVKEKIIFTGRIPRAETPHYYAMSDMVVVPSLQEAFGLVVSEAMACGKPVIGTRVGGIPDQIIDGHNGFLVQPRDPREIAEKVLWFINNPEEAKRMGMNGRKIVEEKYNVDKRSDQIISLYSLLLDGGAVN
jgi:glycosyltransferase involved in cell wall biosynthesis